MTKATANKTKKRPQIKIRTGRASGGGNDTLKEVYSSGEVRSVPLDKWRRDESQPRPLSEVMEDLEEFADHIERDNFKLAILPVYHICDDGTYLNVLGERRTQSFILKGKTEITAICKKFTPDERKWIFIQQYIENDDRSINKKPLSPMADARWWRTFVDEFCEGKISQAAKDRGFSNADVSNRLSLLHSPEQIQHFVVKNHVRDPATFAALNRLWKYSEETVVELMAASEAGELKGSLRSVAEKNATAFKQAAHQQGSNRVGEGSGITNLPVNDIGSANQQNNSKNSGSIVTDGNSKPVINKDLPKPLADAQEMITQAVFLASNNMSTATASQEIAKTLKKALGPMKKAIKHFEELIDA